MGIAQGVIGPNKTPEEGLRGTSVQLLGTALEETWKKYPEKLFEYLQSDFLQGFPQKILNRFFFKMP